MKRRQKRDIDIKIPPSPWRHLPFDEQRLYFAFELIKRKDDFDELENLNPFIEIGGHVWSLGWWKIIIKDLTQPVKITKQYCLDDTTISEEVNFSDPKKHMPVRVGHYQSYPLILSIDDSKEQIDRLLTRIKKILEERKELAYVENKRRQRGRSSAFERLEFDLKIFDLKKEHGNSITYLEIKDAFERQFGESPCGMLTSDALKMAKSKIQKMVENSLREDDTLYNNKKLYRCPINRLLNPYIK
jgi:hypothetical protein